MFATKSQLEQLIQFFDGGHSLSYKKGEYVIRPGEPLTSIFFVKQGFIKAFNISKYGEENFLIIRKENELFPLIWAVTKQERDIVYEALTNCTVQRVDQQTFDDFLKQNPAALPPMVDIITEMYRIHSERLITLQYRTVRERLISFLLSMADRFGITKSDSITIAVPLRHQDIGSSINASRETITRELAYLERNGLVSSQAPYLTLVNVKKLKAHL